MELVAVLLAVAGVLIGMPLRQYVSARLSRAVLLLGSMAGLLGLAIFVSVFAGWISLWAGVGAALGSFALSSILVPLGVTLLWGRSPRDGAL